jgi:hypothetical protein
MTGHTGYTIRQAAYDLRKFRGKELIAKPGRTRRYHLSPQTAGTIAALLTLREQSSHRSSPASAAPAWDANRPPGPVSTATTSSTTWASAPPDRQHLVDQDFVSA